MSAITPELRWHAIGRRKVSVARVYLTPGSGSHASGSSPVRAPSS